MSKKQVESYERRRREIEDAVNQTVEDTIRKAGPMNALAWVVVAGGAFLLNLGLLMVVTGG